MITLELMLRVDDHQEEEMVRLYQDVYVPALRKQVGYLRSALRRPYGRPESEEIGGGVSPWTLVMELTFESEELRRRWVASEEHQSAWPRVEELVAECAWQGFDIVDEDQAGGQ